MAQKYKIEFLLLKGEDTKCNSVPTLKNLLSSDGEVTFNRQKIKVGKVEVIFKASTDLIVDGEKERYFYITLEKEFEAKNEEKTVDDLIVVFKKLKQIIIESGKVFKIAPLWDDTSLYFSKLAYPLIFEIENLMRKLIYQFMLTKLGTGWYKNAVPEEFKKNVTKNERETSAFFEAILYNADFIHVISFLFGKYTVDSNKVIEKIKSAKKISDLRIDELKQLIPEDNWTRYFQPLIAHDKFKEKWKDLYELRCKVAHNTLITKSEYEDIKKLCGELRTKLLTAISSSMKIRIEEESKDELTKSVFISFSDSFRDSFANIYKLNEAYKSYEAGLSNLNTDNFQTGLNNLNTIISMPNHLGMSNMIASSFSNLYLFPTKKCAKCGKDYTPTEISLAVTPGLCDDCKKDPLLVVQNTNSS